MSSYCHDHAFSTFQPIRSFVFLSLSTPLTLYISSELSSLLLFHFRRSDKYRITLLSSHSSLPFSHHFSTPPLTPHITCAFIYPIICSPIVLAMSLSSCRVLCQISARVEDYLPTIPLRAYQISPPLSAYHFSRRHCHAEGERH